MINKFNDITSKEWLPFQKSWFKHDSIEKLYTDNIRFFTKADQTDDTVFYFGSNNKVFENISKLNNLNYTSSDTFKNESIQFAIFDLLDKITEKTTLDDYSELKNRIIKIACSIYNKLVNKRFILIILPNIQISNQFFPFAWDLAKHLSTIFSIKDEKIGCFSDDDCLIKDTTYFSPHKRIFYCLYLKKDESSCGEYKELNLNYFSKYTQQKSNVTFPSTFPRWFILKPQPRNNDEILHPAKYPEELVEMFIKEFSCINNNIFDPMSGTGSTQLGALKMQRNGFGTELSEFFFKIAVKRCKEFIAPSQKTLFVEEKKNIFKILNKDARLIKKDDFPLIDYLITSPPYWDMLNMKGAENQAKRIEKGLQTNYSNNNCDLGNIEDYNVFLNSLVDIYNNIGKFIKPGGYLTIIVKNIKKKGKNYPLAWDLANELQKELILLPEVFWCQDDISIAPYGYGNTWVSNTFHQYCLNFQKPL